MTRFFAASIVPAICAAVIGYFGYYAVWGERGAMALASTRAAIGIQAQKLAEAHDARMRLQHRIDLMEPGHVDPDLLEELARGDLMDGQPGQVAIPRDAR